MYYCAHSQPLPKKSQPPRTFSTPRKFLKPRHQKFLNPSPPQRKFLNPPPKSLNPPLRKFLNPPPQKFPNSTPKNFSTPPPPENISTPTNMLTIFFFFILPLPSTEGSYHILPLRVQPDIVLHFSK